MQKIMLAIFLMQYFSILNISLLSSVALNATTIGNLVAVDLKKWNEILIRNCYMGESGEYCSHRQCCFTLTKRKM